MAPVIRKYWRKQILPGVGMTYQYFHLCRAAPSFHIRLNVGTL